MGKSTPKDYGITHRNTLVTSLRIEKKNINNPPCLCYCSVDVLDKLITNGLFRQQEITSKNYIMIVNEYFKVNTEFYKILLARLDGDYSFEHTFLSRAYVAYPQGAETKHDQANIAKEIIANEKITDARNLSSYFDEYLNLKVKDGIKSEGHIGELKKRLQLFIKLVGDKPVNDYVRADFRKFRDTLEKLPPNFMKRKDLQGKSIDEIIEMTHEKLLSPKTVNGYVNDISTLYNWLVAEGIASKNHATRLSIKQNKPEIDSRDPLNDKDIKTIFGSKKLNSYKNSSASKYWAPWISLYTGMRLEEICQLHCSDIYQHEDGLWVLDLNTKLGKDPKNVKKLKTKNSERIIPIHEHLKELGLIEYLEKIKVNNERLFPELKPAGDRNQLGKTVGNGFGRMIKKLEIEGKKSFHSLRHTFSDFFKKKDMHNTIFEQVFGHSHEKHATQRYGGRFSPQECYEKLIKHLDYGFKREGC